MEVQTRDIRGFMSTHLVELMADAELYGWETVWAFHAVWLQQMEQGRASWKDAELKLGFRCALVWHHSVRHASKHPHPRLSPGNHPRQPPPSTSLQSQVPEHVLSTRTGAPSKTNIPKNLMCAHTVWLLLIGYVPPARFFLNRLLETLRACTVVGAASLSPGF